jgi:hypothetical protein
MLIQILELSALDFLFMFFSDAMQSIFFMNELFAAFIPFYDWMMMMDICLAWLIRSSYFANFSPHWSQTSISLL